MLRMQLINFVVTVSGEALNKAFSLKVRHGSPEGSRQAHHERSQLSQDKIDLTWL